MSPAMASAVAAVSALPMPLRLDHSTAVSALSRPPRLHRHHTSPVGAVPFRGRPRRPTTAVCYAIPSRDYSASVPVLSIIPANDDMSIFKLTLDLTVEPELVASYTTPGQYVLASVPSSGLPVACMEIASAPHSGAQFDLLVRSVPGTTAEQLCNLAVGDLVNLGAVMGPGFPVNKIIEAKTLLYFAVAEGLSPIRALIRSGYTNNLAFYYGARNKEAEPLKGEIAEWKEAGINVTEVLSEPVQYPFLRDPEIPNPDSTVAILVGPIEMQQEVSKVLRGMGVPAEDIITIPKWYPNY